MLGNDNSNIGKQIGSSYRIVAELGRGGFGDVYLGQHIFFANRPPVAIKLLHTFLRSPKERDQFIQEAQLLNSLTHPHILPILDAGMHESLPFIVMEYASGGSLQDRLEQHPKQPFPIAEAITIITHIGEALHYAHQQNIVHRDLKPDNILFNSKGEAMLADFGLAAILSSAGTRDIGSAGTPAYMAPEMFEGKVSVKSDQYALGCIAYELVTGRKPIEIEGLPVIAVQYQHAKVEPIAPSQHNPRISSHIEQAILKAMTKDRTNRHADIRAFLTALQTPKKSAQEWLKEGNALYNLKRYEEAIAAYDQAIRLNPNYALAYNNKGIALKNLKRHEEAIAASDQAIRIDPSYAPAYHNKGNALADLKRYEEAIAAYDQAIRLNPNYALAYNNKGNALYELKRYEEAIGAYEQAIRLDPNYAVAYNNKGVALDQLGRKREAQQAYERAKQLGYGS